MLLFQEQQQQQKSIKMETCFFFPVWMFYVNVVNRMANSSCVCHVGYVLVHNISIQTRFGTIVFAAPVVISDCCCIIKNRFINLPHRQTNRFTIVCSIYYPRFEINFITA